MIRLYTQIVGLGLILFGFAGLINIVGLEPPTNIFHLVVGGLFTYVGFIQKDEPIVRTIVGGLGLLLLLVKGVVIATPLLWGDAPLFSPVEITCLVVGILSILVARFLPGDTSERP